MISIAMRVQCVRLLNLLLLSEVHAYVRRGRIWLEMNFWNFQFNEQRDWKRNGAKESGNSIYQTHLHNVIEIEDEILR